MSGSRQIQRRQAPTLPVIRSLSSDNSAVVIVLSLMIVFFQVQSGLARSDKPANSSIPSHNQFINHLNPAFLITPEEARDWHAFKARGGPTFSGNESWKRFMTFVEKKLKEYGAVDVTRNSFTYDRWHTSEWPDTSKWSLVSNQRRVRVASYGAYSGSTGPQGITTELLYYDPSNPPKDIAGKIVVWQPKLTREQIEAISNPDFESPATEDSYPRSGMVYPTSPNEVSSRIWAQLPQVGAFARLASRGKAAGALLVFDATYDQMSGIYTFPCPEPYNVPSLYLDRTAGAQVIKDARQGSRATLTLQAEVTPTETWQLISYLPGMNYGTPKDEMILFSTHTDGPSISQENGAFGLLAVAKYFSNIPQSERPRTLMFFMDNRHFMPGGERRFASQDWLAKNPSYREKVVAVIGMEHLGQIEYVEDGDKLKPSGRIDQSNVYVTNNRKMIDLAIKAVSDNDLKGAFVRCPGKPGHLGKSQGPWYGLGGLTIRIGTPGFSTMGSMGAYWATSSQLDRFYAELFCRQVATFSQLTGELMLADMKELQTAPGTTPPPARPAEPPGL
jgi:hypothetical protein